MRKKKYHFIAIGGAVMHQLALHLHNSGHFVTGSDDVIFDPAYTNLKNHGILPKDFGWFPKRIHYNLDAVILGMHAQKDNPELKEAQRLGVKIYSFPEFIYEQSKDKKRIVVAGSHGKTTTTSMIMHVLKSANIDFDYLVGAEIKGFDYVVKTSEHAKYIVIEGDEYLTSPLDLKSKFLHYHPHLAILTGIAWDHINVFPTFPEYVDTFRKFMQSVKEKIYYYFEDEDLKRLSEEDFKAEIVSYSPFETELTGDTVLLSFRTEKVPLKIFGRHNMANLKAAYLVCHDIGVSDEDFFSHIQSFEGAAKRMELLYRDDSQKLTVYKDFAHAPSKVTATVKAVRERYPDLKLVAALELHTYSSLQKDFIHQYNGSLSSANLTCVFVDEENLKLKNRPPIDSNWLKTQFGDSAPTVFKDSQELENWLKEQVGTNTVILLMSSGHWGGMELKNIWSVKN